HDAWLEARIAPAVREARECARRATRADHALAARVPVPREREVALGGTDRATVFPPDVMERDIVHGTLRLPAAQAQRARARRQDRAARELLRERREVRSLEGLVRDRPDGVRDLDVLLVHIDVPHVARVRAQGMVLAALVE